MQGHVIKYGVNNSLDMLWSLGFVATMSFIIQVVSGYVIAFGWGASLVGEANAADGSNTILYESMGAVNHEKYLMNMVRYLHAGYPSLVFAALYVHALKAFIKGSTVRHMNTLTLGVLIGVAMYATAFLGYSLIYGNMAHWAVMVIFSLLTFVPWLFETIAGDSAPNPGTILNRVQLLHYIVAIVTLVLIVVHLGYLHWSGSTPAVSNSYSYSSFMPTLYKDMSIVTIALVLVSGLLVSGYIVVAHSDNAISVDTGATPAHIVPEWYLLSVYGGLKSVPGKIAGILVIVALFLSHLLL